MSGRLLEQDAGWALGRVGRLGTGLTDCFVEALLGTLRAATAFLRHAELFAEITETPCAALDGVFDVFFSDCATDAHIHCRDSFKPYWLMSGAAEWAVGRARIRTLHSLGENQFACPRCSQGINHAFMFYENAGAIVEELLAADGRIEFPSGRSGRLRGAGSIEEGG